MRRFLLIIILLFPLLVSAQQKPTQLWKPWYISPRTADQHKDLNGEWELSYLDSPISKLADLAPRKDPFTTTIPNSIHWSLFKGGKLPHPYYNLNSEKYRWTDEKVWYYQKSVELPVTAKDKYIFLCFDGTDYYTRVWVNDSLAGIHEGMFGGPNVEISRFVKYGAVNKIVVELKAGDWGLKPGTNANLERVASGRLDFTGRAGYNPRASGKVIKPWVISGGSGGEAFFSLGMWQGARIELVPKIHLERPYLFTKSITKPGSTVHVSGEVLVNTHSLLQDLHPWVNTQIRHPDEKGVPFIPAKEKLSVDVEFYQAGIKKFSRNISVKAYQGRNWFEEDLLIPNASVWQPNGLGQPNLYQVKILLHNNGNITDRHELDFGIRTIDRVATAGPRTGDRYDNWQFIVNGKKIFVKGMNFTPQDILLDASPERYRWTLSAAKAMGIQLVRIWGGGLIETDIFYRICDELGIMVWQDFPIGNQDTPEYPQDVWEAQVVQNIFRLRNHPSLVVWCGGNEFNPYSYGNAASIGILERNLRTFDDSRLFVRTTPDQGSIHVYPDMDPTWYKRSYGQEAWISETGMHSMPEAPLFYETVDQKEFKGLGKMWDTAFAGTHPDFIHHFTEYGPGRVPRMLSRASHIDNMGDPSIESVTEASQVGAGEFYQILSEQVQGNYPVTTGLMPWVFKRHWPVIAIQMMDWFGQAAAPYYFLKRTYEPTHVSVDLDRLIFAPGESIDLRIQVTNSLNTVPTGLKTILRIYNDAFKELVKIEKPVNVPGGTSVTKIPAGAYLIPGGYRDRFVFILAELIDAKGNVLSSSFYYPRSISAMEDKTFHDKYLNEPIPWITFDKGPWLRPVVAKNATSLRLAITGTKKQNEQESFITASITNTGKLPAFMTKIDVKGVKRAFFASDNYFWLKPGETKTVSMNLLWREQAAEAKLEASAWNSAPVSATIKP